MKMHSACAVPLERIRSAMLGHAVADALGVPVEFMSREALRSEPVTDYRGYGSHPVPAGTWSDDTSMALATLDSLARGLDYEDMMRRFCSWKQEAAYTATDEVFDMGITTSHALNRSIRGIPAAECGCGDEYDNGNGSLMRIVSAALYCSGFMPDAPAEEHMEVIHRISALTHSHPRSLMGCGIYAQVLMELLAEPDRRAVASGLKKAEAYYRARPEFRDELSRYERVFSMCAELPEEDEIQSGGYVVSTLEAALWCLLTTESYAECVLKAVNLGSDTDTVAAVAGGLAGVLYGCGLIPARWCEGLIRCDMIEALCAAFAGACGGTN